MHKNIRHINIPVFIPHLGCPNDCVFCNQRTISGTLEFHPESVTDIIDTALSTIPTDAEAEIAFFGGSFTGIDRGLMIHLLDTAELYVNSGKVRSVRLSTRPDYINCEILDILKNYSVKTIELGIQSMNDNVLAASRRGHTSEQSREACRLIKQYGFSLVGQMMIGLPASIGQDEVYTAEQVCDMGVNAARVYPTVVFRDTELCRMAERGSHTIPSEAETIERTKNVLSVFAERGVEVIRVGLCSSENLADDSMVYGGANHAAIGELAMGEIYMDKISDCLLSSGVRGGIVTVSVPMGEVSKAVGQRKKNSIRLCKQFELDKIKFVPDASLKLYEIKIDSYIPVRRIDNCI